MPIVPTTYTNANPVYAQDYNQKTKNIPVAYTLPIDEEIPDKPDEFNYRQPISSIRQAANIAARYEKPIATVYDDGFGNPTIGYGERTKWSDKRVLTQEQMENGLMQKLSVIHKDFLGKYPGYAAMSNNSQGGILDVAYNIGSFKKGEDMDTYLRNPKYIPQAIQMLPSYRRVNGKIVFGLEKRRADDYRLASMKTNYEYFPAFVDYGRPR